MAIRTGIDLSDVTLIGSEEEEQTAARNPLSEVTMLSTPTTPDVEDPQRVADTGTVLKEYDAPWYEDVADFAKGVKDYMTHGESWSVLHNTFKATMPQKEYVPVYNDKGELSHLRDETDDEFLARRQAHKEFMRKQHGLDDNAAEAWVAKAATLFTDPLTWTPIGFSYFRTAASMGAYMGADVAAYQMAEQGEIDPVDVGVATLMGTILGPTFKLLGNKAVDLYKSIRSKGQTHEQAVKLLTGPEGQKLLPAPPKAPETQKLLPAPGEVKLLPAPGKNDAPFFVNEAGDVVSTPFYGGQRGLREIEVLRAKNVERVAERNEKAADEVLRRLGQGGEVSPALMQHLAVHGLGAAVGGAVGGYADGKEGAVYGAMAGLGAPLVWRHLISKPIGKLSQWAKHDAAGAFARGKFASSPSATLKTFGKPGRALAEMLETMHQNIDMKVGSKLWEFQNKIGHLSTAQMKTVRGLLDHTIKPSSATKAEVAAAKQLRREFNAVLDEAVETGILKAKQVRELKAAAMTKGYFPRMYNIDYLSSAKGKEAWVKAWTEFTGDKKTLESALESIVGDKDIVAKMVARSDGKLTRKEALDLLKVMRNRSQNARSAHLEKARKIDESAEEILRPFLVDDPVAAIAKYFNDAYRRIESSRLFGNQVAPKTKKGLPRWNPDAKAEALIDDLAREYGREAEYTARETFLNAVGDPSSEILNKYVKLGDLEGRILRGVGGFETGAKLGLASMANVMQATVNGITRLANISGNPFTTLRLYAKGIARASRKEGGEFADRVGAALETTLMEIAGESSKVGRFGEGVLRYTGFIAAEKMQRRLGANIGRAYAEELAEKFVQIQQGAIKGRRSAKILAQMKELGLPTTRSITTTDIERAGLRFSNDINFRNTPDMLPLAWQTPYGRLFTKFKSFAFHQSRFVKNNVIKPLLRGNPWPLIWYASGASGIGMGVDELRRLVKGDDRELSDTERYLRGITMIGGMGILQDTISQFHQGPEKGLASMAGPALGDVARLSSGATNSILEQDPKKMLNALTRTFVFPGQQSLVDAIGEEGKRRGTRSSGRSSNRGSGR